MVEWILGTNLLTNLYLAVGGDAKAVACPAEVVRHAADESEATFVTRYRPRSSSIVRLVSNACYIWVAVRYAS
jgi:hypothetical protein